MPVNRVLAVRALKVIWESCWRHKADEYNCWPLVRLGPGDRRDALIFGFYSERHPAPSESESDIVGSH